MNKTAVLEFIFLGFQNPPQINHVLFVLFLVIYIMIIVGNLLIVILVAKVQSLNAPMYFFLSQLSLSDILLTTNIVPNMLHVIFNGRSTISITGCIVQFYFFAATVATECLLLTVMSYDRYLAICRPLHYTSIMDFDLQVKLALWSWIFSFLIVLVLVFLINDIQFCEPPFIDHYFCDLAPVVQLSCSKNSIVEKADFVMAIPLAVVPFFFIVFTYVSIFKTIFGISSPGGTKKFFSTCSSHLIVVSTYYGTIIIVYMTPSKGQLFNINKVISLLYTMGTPFFNPIIYSFRNQEIKNALIKCLLALTQKK
ncbi:olfactory receptor 6B1-like [Spea bombifrons]|uniref:olfactory receptor 6B1-like n=1 Tax=Spea bombifrons TaxID=233779 RepID=UPI0023490937|nr:olfactory receptor 6B1-like [Spea bombifrons]